MPKRGKIVVLGLLLAWCLLAFWNTAKPLPAGTHVASMTRRLADSDVAFLFDPPERLEESARETAAIDRAEQLIVLDGTPIAHDLEQRLLARKHARPGLKIVLLTDPANPAFSAAHAQDLLSLERAGIIVARARLDRLRDSSPLYSGLWRLCIAWWSDPFEEAAGDAGMPARLRMLNFKADQRQLLVADDGAGGWTSIVVSAGAGLMLRGRLAHDIAASELQIATWSTEDDRLPGAPQMDGGAVGSIDARFLTEGAILGALLDAIGTAGRGDRIAIAVHDLSDRRIIAAALHAAARGAHLQVLLQQKNMPNGVVAAELMRDGAGRIEVRGCPPGCPAAANLLILRHGNDLWVNLGSANFTRRNLEDLNLEANVELRMQASAAPARAATDYFAAAWAGAASYAAFADDSQTGYWRYRLAEATGLSSF